METELLIRWVILGMGVLWLLLFGLLQLQFAMLRHLTGWLKSVSDAQLEDRRMILEMLTDDGEEDEADDDAL